MHAILLFLLTAALPGPAWSSEPPAMPEALRPEVQPSPRLQDALRQTAAELVKTETGRRLLAQTEELPVLERRGRDIPVVRYVAAPSPRLLVDAKAAAALTLFDFEAAFILERRRASAQCSAALFEDDFAAHQELLAYAMEKAEADGAFAKELRAAYRREEAIFLARDRIAESSRKLDGEPLADRPVPKNALAAAALELYLFSEDPYLLYSTLEHSLRWSSETVHLTDLEDFLSNHAGRLQDMSWKAEGRVCLAQGRPYPGALCRAARVVADREGLSRVQEGIGPYDSILQDRLRVKVNRWIREGR
ncbi:MAG: hypothetical protein WCU88_01590 [Elusimicrobiota bacterium]